MLEVASWWKKHINDNDADFTQAVEEKAKLLADPDPKPGNPTGANQYGKGKGKDVSNSPSQRDRASANGITVQHQRKLDRIARESPELLSQVQAGTKTINKAAVELGIVKVRSPLEQVIAAFQRLSSDDNDPATDC